MFLKSLPSKTALRFNWVTEKVPIETTHPTKIQ